MAIPFLKMQGLGNDFVVVDDLGKPPGLCQPLDAELARRICDRRFGVGADQLLWLRTGLDERSDARMEIFNADGSVAEMCGNGIRAVALYLYRYGPRRKPGYAVETLAGLKHLEVQDGQVRVDMGAPGLGGGFGPPAEGEAIQILGRGLRFFEVDLGNPHAVLFVDDLGACDAERIGPLMETHARFPRRTNVEFVHVLGAGKIQVRVWERGAGLTLACGTGASAAAVAALATGRVQGTIEVALPGGSLRISWSLGSSVWMEGPAEEVFRGEFFA